MNNLPKTVFSLLMGAALLLPGYLVVGAMAQDQQDKVLAQKNKKGKKGKKQAEKVEQGAPSPAKKPTEKTTK